MRFRKKEKVPAPDTETVPTFLCAGERIVDVAYTTWRGSPDGLSWTLSERSDRVRVDEAVDRIVFETPVGCFETPLRLGPGDTLTFQSRGRPTADLARCRAPKRFESAEAEAERAMA